MKVLRDVIVKYQCQQPTVSALGRGRFLPRHLGEGSRIVDALASRQSHICENIENPSQRSNFKFRMHRNFNKFVRSKDNSSVNSCFRRSTTTIGYADIQMPPRPVKSINMRLLVDRC